MKLWYLVTVSFDLYQWNVKQCNFDGIHNGNCGILVLSAQLIAEQKNNPNSFISNQLMNSYLNWILFFFFVELVSETISQKSSNMDWKKN